MRIRIAQISDTHINGIEFVPQWAENVVRLLNEINPDILIVTGDLTNNGYLFEYEAVQKFLGKIKVENKIVVPGNHDARNEGYKLFEEFFTTRFPKYEDDFIVILGLDSSEPDLDDGHIGRENYELIRDTFSGEEDKVKIMALHHHLLPVPGTGRERNIPVDAGDVLKMCCDLKVNIVLSGHKHKPWIWRLENIYFITAGTATTKRLKARSYPSFNLLIIDEKGLKVEEINVIDGSSALRIEDESIKLRS